MTTYYINGAPFIYASSDPSPPEHLVSEINDINDHQQEQQQQQQQQHNQQQQQETGSYASSLIANAGSSEDEDYRNADVEDLDVDLSTG